MVEDPTATLPVWKKVFFVSIMGLLPIFGLFGVEGGARIFMWLRHGVPGKRYGIWRSDRELGAIHRESAYNSMGETNDMGFRNKEDVLQPKPPGSLRLITYGGSTTFCYNLRNEEAWPARLEQLMRERRPGGGRDQVLNGGAVMWSLGHLFARAKRDLPVLKPDYVLIYSGVNEYWNALLLAEDGVSMDDLVRQGRYGVITKHLEQANWVTRELLTAKLYTTYLSPRIHWIWDTLTDAPELVWPSGPVPSTLENYEHVLRDMIRLAKENGATSVFVVEITGNPTPKNLYLTSYSRAGARVATEAGAIVIDPSPILEGNPDGPQSLYSDTGVHYSEPGARKLAAFLFEHLFARQTGNDQTLQ